MSTMMRPGLAVAMDNRPRDDDYWCNASRKSTPEQARRTDRVVEASKCDHIRVPDGLMIRIGHKGLRTVSLSAMRSTATRRGLARDIVGIFARRDRSCCHVYSRHHSAHTINLSIFRYSFNKSQ